jgi:hypothetical protein
MIIVENELGFTKYHKDKKLIGSTYKERIDKDMPFNHLKKVVEIYKNKKVKTEVHELYGSLTNVMEYLPVSFHLIAVINGLNAQAFILVDNLIIRNLTIELEGLTSKVNILACIFYFNEEAVDWIETI